MPMRYLSIVMVAAVVTACGTGEKKPGMFVEETTALYDSALRPFYHGVASGDPLADRVIIWTRVTPEDSMKNIPVKWQVSTSADFSTIAREDTTSTSSSRDYTVKIDVDGLDAGATYYYRFEALGAWSPAGRTRTLPSGPSDSLKFAVVSCSNWEWGYFNPYEKIAARNDVNAVLHLGDYIYEYGRGKYGDTTIRKNLPPHEIITLQDYRTRHSSYRTDKGLRLMSAAHPLIAIWDDHEVANNSYTAGAQNHQADQEGDYIKRKEAARKAYYEWIPIRESAVHYRSFSYGSLADVIMLDERLEGRTKPVDSLTDPNLNSEDRTMLGTQQLQWLEQQLGSSTATWKVIGNQVMYSDIYLSKVYPNMPRNLDSWDGYPSEKNKLRDHIVGNQLKDLIFLTGDTHASWAIEVAFDVKKTYNAASSAGAFAVEFGTTSVSSANDDEYRDVETVKNMEAALLKDNPHIKYLNDRDHGYLLLTLFPDRARAEWYYMETVRKPDTNEYLARQFEVKRGTVKLVGGR